MSASAQSIVFRLFLSATVALVLIVAGCGGGPELVPASGVVTLDGEPLEGATISFVPTSANEDGDATSGTDVTGPEGNFSMTFKGRNGLAPGTYRVMVSKTEEIAPPDGREIPDVFAKASVEKELMGLTKETIPPQSYEHEVEVPEEGATDFLIDLKSKSD